MTECPSQETPEKEWSRFTPPKEEKGNLHHEKEKETVAQEDKNERVELFLNSFLVGAGVTAGAYFSWCAGTCLAETFKSWKFLFK